MSTLFSWLTKLLRGSGRMLLISSKLSSLIEMDFSELQLSSSDFFSSFLAVGSLEFRGFGFRYS